MTEFSADITSRLRRLCSENVACESQLVSYISKKSWNANDKQDVLNDLALLLLDHNCCQKIAEIFKTVLLDLLHRCRKHTHLNDQLDHSVHQKFCVSLSKLITFHNDAKNFSVTYFQTTARFYLDCNGNDEPQRKKTKKAKLYKLSQKHIIEAVYRIVQCVGEDLREVWCWTDFLDHLKSKNLDTRWFALHTVAVLADLDSRKCEHFQNLHFSKDEQQMLRLRHGQYEVDKCSFIDECLDSQSVGTLTAAKLFQTTDHCPAVTSVCDVVLNKITQHVSTTGNLVSVASTERALHALALAVAAGRFVLLEGPVGCGKTSLVEHIAMCTGRTGPPELLKVQLGDQTDSKALLGTYRCTDVPGEFVWQAGSITRAVTQGHWVLLEDLDYAPMDVVSLLVPLLESRTLTLPGHGGHIIAHPEFKLFASQRLLYSGSGWYRPHHATTAILDKLWTRILVEPLSRAELYDVITQTSPQLSTVADRLLDIYCSLAATHHVTDSTNVDDEELKPKHQDGRLISTRDLMKWVSRISVDFDVTAMSTGLSVLQEGLDCFCACIPRPERRLQLAEAIAAKLNITKSKAAFYCCKHKPNLELTGKHFSVGRVSLTRSHKEGLLIHDDHARFAFTRQAVVLMERVAVCVFNQEPVLLVGETGTGKTSSVQYLAHQMGHRLRVINMNQQSDSTDLLGGFKPIEIKFVVAPVREEFELLFCKSFSRKQNIKFLGHIQDCYSKRRWTDLFKLMEHSQRSAVKKCEKGTDQHHEWEMMGRQLLQLKAQVRQAESALAFSFIEGSLVRAIRNGEWVLLDEINLASADTLECLSGLLESTHGSLVLMERGDTEPIERHKNFRLFACMNPATDVGKKDLPPGVRNRFTELFVEELEDSEDLRVLVAEYLRGLSLSAAHIENIVKFYLLVRQKANKQLTDGTGHRPHYSLRTLCRALSQAASNMYGQPLRSLYEGFCLSFLTQLDRSSHPVVEQLVCQHVVGKSNIKSIIKKPLPEFTDRKCLNFEGYWVTVGTKEPIVPDEYVLTPSVRANLRDLARVVSAGRHPVLLQGETSVGKTSLTTWLAQSSGNVCLRINNHEHTDIQEYVGCYAADTTGKLVFKEGVLVEAMRFGHWVILDELNLAPSDVLEALNRLLDDNRELFIPETQETVKAHPRFMLFATQNPPGHYGGRKMLSRAFRNRFVELHFDEIPSKELETILHQRCSLPKSYCARLVAILLDLQRRRRGTSVFAGKQGFITLRDLFRWAERYRRASQGANRKFFDWDQLLADNGYLLLAGRVRRPEECVLIQEVLEKHLKRHVDPDLLFTLSDEVSPTTAPLLQSSMNCSLPDFQHVVWTYSMRRMAVLLGQALKFGEPVLLVGDTGCGKTTMCQIYSALQEQKLYSVNCHLHTEAADFLGGLRPVRHQDQDSDGPQRLFEWMDGPLVQSMQDGSMFLIDEISLADDSVLERLNSVLEPERSLLLAEKGGGDGLNNEVETIVAKENFRIVATMNPGGDYGKKELSPALRNRFTEIWCPLSLERDDLVGIIEHNLQPGIKLATEHSSTADSNSGIGNAIMDFVEWFTNNHIGKRCTVSIRDILCWVHFINATTKVLIENGTDTEHRAVLSCLEPAVAYIHGACMVFLDALGSGITGSSDPRSAVEVRQTCLQFLTQQLHQVTGCTYTLAELGLDGPTSSEPTNTQEAVFGIHPFYISTGSSEAGPGPKYALDAPTPGQNAVRLLRALQLPRAILLEGSPGVGKTSLVAALARAASHTLVRINLSEQTDVTDLFGADLPVEGGKGGQFSWRDGPLLQALRAGHWVVFDELNLASQSVLEGLNACLDHRGEVYVPELGRSFQVQHDKTRLFACQNPLYQGGGRKGLPRSFLNRFTQVYVEPLQEVDLKFISCSLYPQLPHPLLDLMITFNTKIHQQTMVECSWGQLGAPWEFNLRDLFRWCDLMSHNQSAEHYDPVEYAPLIYADRLRTSVDREKVLALFEAVFGRSVTAPDSELIVTAASVQVGHSFLPRVGATRQITSINNELHALHHTLAPLKSLIKCMQMNWMPILVGSSGSGKTSLVRLLSQLCGRPLHILPMNSSMDTTELLGGFEQVDVSRHVEDVGHRVRELLQKVTSHLLITTTDQTQMLQHLWKAWRRYTKLEQDASVQQEGEKLEKQLDRLEGVLSKVADLLPSLPPTLHDEVHSEVEEVELQVSGLQRDVRGGAQASSGRFEWVDSILVQALRAGHWLLIDNVNFCSASVLDRLNALLEPHGVLTISERGVLDGSIPTITPHPDFRLILAMDPRHGEISRAMRNRGVEVYILSQEEGRPYDSHDLHCMLTAAGIVGRLPCDLLIQLHQALQEKALRPKQFSMSDLLRMATLASQQIQNGAKFLDAVQYSAEEVYVRALLDLHEKQELMNVIREVVSECASLNSASSQLIDLGVWPHGLPTLRDWCQDTDLSSVHKLTAMLLYFSQQISDNAQQSASQITYGVLSTLDSAPDVPCNPEDSPPACLPTAIKLLLEGATLRYWRLLSARVGEAVSGLQGLQPLVPLIQEPLTAIFTHPLMEQLRTTLDGFQPLNSDLAEAGYDLRWNIPLLQRVVMEMDRPDKPQSAATLSHRNQLANQLCLVGELAYTRTLHITLAAPTRSTLASPQLSSPLQLSHSLHQGELTVGELPNAALAHLRPLVQLLDARLHTVFLTDRHLSDTDLTQTRTALVWYRRFVGVCAAAPTHLPRLALHWHWLHQHCLQPLHAQHGLGVDLEAVVDQLHIALGLESTHAQLHHQLGGALGRPAPYPRPSAAHSLLCLDQFSAALCLRTRTASERAAVGRKLVLLLSEQGAKIQALMVKMAQDLWSSSGEEETSSADYIQETMQQIEDVLKEHHLLEALYQDQSHEPMAEDGGENQPIKTHDPDYSQVALLPLYDFLFLCEAHAALTTRKKLPVMDVNQLQMLLAFTQTRSTLTPSLALPWHQMLSSNQTGSSSWSHCEVFLSLMQHLDHSMVTEIRAALPPTPQSPPSTTPTKGISTLFSPVLSQVTYDLTCDLNVLTEGIEGQTGNIPVGQHREKLAQIAEISAQLWTHAGVLSSSHWSPSMNSAKLWVAVFRELNQQLHAVTSPTQQVSPPQGFSPLTQPLRADQLAALSGLYPDVGLVYPQCVQSLEDMERIAGEGGSVSALGQAWVWLGLLQTHLLAPQGPVDPAVALAEQLTHSQSEVCAISTELRVRDWHSLLITGHPVTMETTTTHPVLGDMSPHPTLTSLGDRQCTLQTWIDDQQVPVRPSPPQFDALLREVKQFVVSVCGGARVRGLVGGLAPRPGGKKGGPGGKAGAGVAQCRAWLQTCAQFVQRTRDQYPYYRDLLLPWLAAIMQLHMGLELLLQEVGVAAALQALTVPAHTAATVCDVEELLESLCQLPQCLPQSPGGSSCSLIQARHLVSEKWQGMLQICLAQSQSEAELPVTQLIARTLRAALLHMQNHAGLSSTLDKDTLDVATNIFQLYLLSWKQAEDARRLKEEEDAALYHFKSQEHGEALTELEQEERDIKQQFPKFDQEFADITVGFTLEGTADKNGAGEDDLTASPVVSHLSVEEMCAVSIIHHTLFTTLTSTNWHKGAPQLAKDEVNMVIPQLVTYPVAAAVAQTVPQLLSVSVQGRVVGGQLLQCAILQAAVLQDSPLTQKRLRPYDVYHDANVAEVIQCRPLLEQFGRRLAVLLEEWPDHPTLKQLMELKSRILSFSVTSPLMRYITGLEILLQKAQEWESNAARHVSLSENLDAITHLVIQWRKLELQCWKSCLDTVRWQFEQSASKWWFHLYELLQPFLHPAAAAEDEDKDVPEVAALTSSLQELMETSPIGEYQPRLQLLQAYCCHLVHAQTHHTPELTEVLCVLWNVVQHYKQFLPSVDALIQKLRAPIETQIKAYVKIARWNDINFYALKQAVNKAHHTVHKHSKAFRNALLQPARQALVESDKPDWMPETSPVTDSSSSQTALVYLLPETEVSRDSLQIIPETSLLHRLPTFTHRLHRHCQSLFTHTPFPGIISSLNHFTGELIEAVHEYQGLEVPPGIDKEKRKMQTKHIHLRKRKALADLFKYLQELGLSYRRGLILLQRGDDVLLDALRTAPVDVDVALSHLSPIRCDADTRISWQGCQKYYIKCVTRRSQFHSVLAQPSQELGAGNVARLKGFSEHLMRLVLKQRRSLTASVNTLVSLRRSISQLNLVTNDSTLPPQDETLNWLGRLRQCCTVTVEGLLQLEAILHCCPKAPPTHTFPSSPCHTACLPAAAGLTQTDPRWTEIQSQIQMILTTTRKIEAPICEALTLQTPATNATLVILRDTFTQLSTAISSLQPLHELFSSQSESAAVNPLLQGLVSVQNHVQQQAECCISWLNDLHQQREDRSTADNMHHQIQGHLEALLEDLLLAVQHIVKAAKVPQPQEEITEEDDTELLEKHLTEQLHKQLTSHLGLLNTSKVAQHVEDVLAALVSSDRGGCISLTGSTRAAVTRCLPLLTQYCQLVQFYTSQLLHAHRSTAKLTSVLLAVFSELVTKGFCLPTEYSDEADGEGATEFKDIESGGLGEGQGTKDVSDQIETEDQLEDAHQQGQEKPEEDPSEQPDIPEEDNAIEMSGDMDGKTHDLPREEGDEEGSDEDDGDEEAEAELDKEMGDLGDETADKLDEQVWGSDDEEEVEEQKSEKEEFGPGAGPQSEPDLVAKDDNQDQTETDNKETKEQQPSEEQMKELEQMDERDYEEEMPTQGAPQSPQEDIEPLDLPDDLKLDSDGEQEEGGEPEGLEENTQEVDKMLEEEEGKKDAEENKDEEEKDPTEQQQEAENPDKKDISEIPEKDDTDAKEEEDDTGKERGFEPQEPEQDEPIDADADPSQTDEPPPAVEAVGKKQHNTPAVEELESAQDGASSQDQQQEQKDGLGAAENQVEQGHQGDSSSMVTRGSAGEQKQSSQRQAGESREDRSLGSTDDKVHRRLKTVDTHKNRDDQPPDHQPPDKSEMYEHIKESESHHDAQTLDAATEQQLQQQPTSGLQAEEEEEEMEGVEETELPPDEEMQKEECQVEDLLATKMKQPSKKQGEDGDNEGEVDEDGNPIEISGEKIETSTVIRGAESTVHTAMEFDVLLGGEVDVEALRSQLEDELTMWHQTERPSRQEEQAAEEAWQRYEALTAGLAQELCEQLRLVLEPTQASKLRGDYRTGKRLNMRKVIPYIASQYRKDKIWLRRTKPSKRQYQVMVAVDDSSSMTDNHSKQLAFESLAVIANALLLLEVGELGICSFGETVKLLHSFQDPFTSQSGANILQKFTFEQGKTKIAQLLQQLTSVMITARNRHPMGSIGHPETSQLLLVVSDGRGLFLEGMEVVKAAVKQARQSNIFLVFVIIDNPTNKDSILDIRVPVFKEDGQLPEMKSYMDFFPFPFYIILRDVNSLPHTLSDALRQWFELVTATNR